MPSEAASASAVTNGNGTVRVSFSELVRAHHQWDRSDDPAAAEPVYRRFRQLLDDFEASAGEIVNA
jgi:hypothetical protein